MDNEFEDELFKLIDIAYKPIGGNKKITKPTDVSNPSYKFFQMIDLDSDLEADLVIFGKKSKFGIKFSGVGHNGTKVAKKEYLQSRQGLLKKQGFFGEVSGKLAEILVDKYNSPMVTNHKDIEKVLGKKVKFYGEHPTDKSKTGKGWYGRQIGADKEVYKILVGRPKL